MSRQRIVSAWYKWNVVASEIAQGRLYVLDGGVGTLFEAKQVKMDIKGWCCASHLYAPEVCLEVHKEYIEAGSEIITANTYATNRVVLSHNGIGDRTAEAIESAIKIAKKASQTYSNNNTLVAGSLSTHAPEYAANSEVSRDELWPADNVVKEAYVEAANLIADAGADLLFLEMMKEQKRSFFAIHAAGLCGLPVLLGLSTRLLSDGRVVLFGNGNDAIDFTPDILAKWLEAGGQNIVGVNVMHTNFTAMEPTLKIVRKIWDGPLGAYPDHGYFKAPNWEFKELDNEHALHYIKSWVENCNIHFVGGCCGLKPDFIEAVNKYVKTENEARHQAKKNANEKAY